MNLEQAVADNYSAFDGRNRDANLASMDYILGQARRLGLTPASVQLSLFGTTENVLSDRSEINRILFEERERQAGADEDPATDGDGVTLRRSDLSRALGRIQQETVDNLVNKLQEARESSLTRMQESQEQAIAYASQAAEAMLDILRLQEQGLDVTDQIEAISAGSFYTYAGARSGKVTWFTQPIILRMHNDAAGSSLVQPMGRLKVEWDVRAARLKVLAHEDNVYVRDYLHPYVDINGSICWGNGQAEAQKLLSEFKIESAMSLLASLLTTYDPSSSPFVRLNDWPAEGQRR